MLFLWNVSSTDVSSQIRLEFYNSNEDTIEDFLITGYRPYFLTSVPLSKDQIQLIEKNEGEIEPIKKKNLFTDEWLQLVKISASCPKLLRNISKGFGSVWEIEVPLKMSYIYDNGLVFGAPYIYKGKKFKDALKVTQDLKYNFKATFKHGTETSTKLKQIEEWFNLCHQQIPEVNNEFVKSLTDKVKKKQFYLAFLLSRIANIPIPEAFTSRSVSGWIKSMIYFFLRKNQYLIPTSKELRRGKKPHKVAGALTLQPKAGVYFNTIVCDFESLYPSLIDSYNLSYETVDCIHQICKVNKTPSRKHYVCTQRKGFYSILVGALKDLRIHWFKRLKTNKKNLRVKELAEVASRLLKLLSVSSYGVTIRIHGLSCPPLADSITEYGRWVLEKTTEYARKNCMVPIYGDTDSIFLDNPSKEQVETLINIVKEKLALDLAIEKHYSICVLPKAKKAYFGIPLEGPPDLKGLTATKSNAPNFIQNVFKKSIEVLSHAKNMEQYNNAKRKILAVVYDAIRHLKNHDIDLKDLIYSVQLYHDPNNINMNDKTISQPYQCALQLIDTGRKVKRRDIVNFIKVKPFIYKGRTFTVKPVDNIKNVFDVNVDDYIRNLTTALEQIFEPMKIRLEKDESLTKWFSR